MYNIIHFRNIFIKRSRELLIVNRQDRFSVKFSRQCDGEEDIIDVYDS